MMFSKNLAFLKINEQHGKYKFFVPLFGKIIKYSRSTINVHSLSHINGGSYHEFN